MEHIRLNGGGSTEKFGFRRRDHLSGKKLAGGEGEF